MAPLDSNSNQSRGPNHTNNEDPVRSMAAEVVGLALSFQQTGDRWYLKQMLDAMELGIPELRQMFSSQTRTFCKKALEDIQSLWPSTAKDLTPTMLLQIHHCLRASKIAIRYSHLRLFLVRCASSIEEAQQPLDDPKAKEIALDTEKFVSKALELK
ncbi:hypothetical protein KCU67_g3781, partial [Aureobasidium melanogenum]